MYLIIHEKGNNNMISIILINGVIIMEFTEENINFSTKNIIIGQNKALFISYSNDILIFSL